MVRVDVIVVDPESGRPGAYNVKRGNGETAWTMRKPIEQDPRAMPLVLSSQQEKFGHIVTDVTTGAVVYGILTTQRFHPLMLASSTVF